MWIHIHRICFLTGLQASIHALIFWCIDEPCPIQPSSSSDVLTFATVTGKVRNSLIVMATSGTWGNMEWCFMNRVCAKPRTEPSSISFMVDTKALLNERTSGKSADRSSLYWSAKIYTFLDRWEVGHGQLEVVVVFMTAFLQTEIICFYIFVYVLICVFIIPPAQVVEKQCKSLSSNGEDASLMFLYCSRPKEDLLLTLLTQKHFDHTFV